LIQLRIANKKEIFELSTEMIDLIKTELVGSNKVQAEELDKMHFKKSQKIKSQIKKENKDERNKQYDQELINKVIAEGESLFLT